MTEQEFSEDLVRIVQELTFVTDGLEKALGEQFDNILVTCTEAGRHLGVSQSTLTRYLREGKLRKTTIGGSTGIRFSDIIDLKTP